MVESSSSNLLGFHEDRIILRSYGFILELVNHIQQFDQRFDLNSESVARDSSHVTLFVAMKDDGTKVFSAAVAIPYLDDLVGK